MTTIDQIITDWFNNGCNGFLATWFGNFLLILLSIIMAILLSFLIGFEREFHGHAAGLRTHLLVCVGSCLIMIISVYGFGSAFPNRDPARLAAQVVAGIGFLGAGTIVQTGLDVRGLTTATTIWIVMAIGLACGSGNFVIATVATLLSLICLISFRSIERYLAKRNPVLTLVVPSERPVLKDINQIAARYGITILDTRTEIISYQDQSALRIMMRCLFTGDSQITAFMDDIRFSVRPFALSVSTETN